MAGHLPISEGDGVLTEGPRGTAALLVCAGFWLTCPQVSQGFGQPSPFQNALTVCASAWMSPARSRQSLDCLALLQRVQVAFARATTEGNTGHALQHSALKVCTQVPGRAQDPQGSSSQAGDMQGLCKLQDNPCPAALNPSQGGIQDNQRSRDTTTGTTVRVAKVFGSSLGRVEPLQCEGAPEHLQHMGWEPWQGGLHRGLACGARDSQALSVRPHEGELRLLQ